MVGYGENRSVLLCESDCSACFGRQFAVPVLHEVGDVGHDGSGEFVIEYPCRSYRIRPVVHKHIAIRVQRDFPSCQCCRINRRSIGVTNSGKYSTTSAFMLYRIFDVLRKPPCIIRLINVSHPHYPHQAEELKSAVQVRCRGNLRIPSATICR